MKQKISSFQAVALIYSTIVPTAVLVVPGVVIHHSREDAWISIVLATLFCACSVLFYGSMLRRNPDKPFVAWIGERLGRTTGIIVGLLLTLYYISIGAVILEEFSNFLNDQVLLQTPSIFIMIVIMAVTGYAVSQGVEVISRMNLIVTGVAVVVYGASFFMFSNIMKPHLLQPMLSNSFAHIAYGSVLPISWISESAFVLILAPHIERPAHAGKLAAWAILLAGFHLTITVLLAIAVLGPDLPQVFQYPSFNLIEVLKIGNFLERIDILFVSFWICTIYIKMSVFLFGAFHCLTHTFRLRPAKPLIWALCLLIMVTALFSYREESVFNYQNQAVTPIGLIMMNVALPLVLWICLRLREGKAWKKEES